MKISLLITFFFLCAFAAFCQTGNWTWVGGDSVLNNQGSYGMQGVPASGNLPHSRYSAVNWKDNNGDFWLFGGFPWCNDLWKYNIASNEWTFIKGNTTNYDNGVYGSRGMPSGNNQPGGRFAAVSWTDKSGNLWLFGGDAFPANGGNYGYANDLWKYNIATTQWTWISGDSTVNNTGVYGVRGIPSTTNKPGGRRDAMSWTDNNGNLWLFGGDGYDALGLNSYPFNDLWEYNIASNQWTWMKGDSLGNQASVYGTLGQPDSVNTPGGREDAVAWADDKGNLWLFGGNLGYHNDLWKYTIATNQWTWVNGSTTGASIGNYGEQGVTAIGNQPGGRQNIVGWTDTSGNFWLLGGEGRNASYTYVWFNDLWKYNMAANLWTWMKGDSTGNNNGVYGALGVQSPSNTPGSRIATIGWTDSSGGLWLFGGYGYPATGSAPLSSSLNDLWKFSLSVTTTTPKVKFTASADTICAGSTVSFTDESTGSPLSWNWTFTGATPDTSTAQNPTITYKTADTYTVKLVVKNAGGSDSVTKTGYITVVTLPDAGTPTAQPDTLCSGNSTLLTVTGSSGNIQWQSSPTGNGFTNLSNGSDTVYSTPRLSQTVYYRTIATNGICGDTSSPVIVIVNPLPDPPLLSAADSVICASDSALITTSGSYPSYRWNNGSNRSFTYADAAGGYWVTVTDGNGCTAVSNHQEIAVFPVPSVSIVQQGDTLSSFGAVSYQWFLNNDSLPRDTNSICIAREPGNYSVQVTDTNGCKALSNNTPVLITGVTETDENSALDIYPNPFTNLISICWKDAGIRIENVKLVDVVGKIMMNKIWKDTYGGLSAIEMFDLPAGVYYVKIETTKNNFIRKMIKL